MICSKRRRNFNVKSLKPVMVIISILQLLASSMAVAQNENSHESVFYIADDASLTGNVTMVALSKDDLDCSLLCLRSPYPHNCFSFNFGRHKKNGLHTCELNNSEKILLPHRMQSRGGFDYYGMQRDFLARFFPCLSSPCRNGGTCVNGTELETFSCNCPLEIKALPYIDTRCNVDNSLIHFPVRPVKGVFTIAVGPRVLTYSLNYFEAQRICEMHGAALVSSEQLTEAWEAGLEYCRWGWLEDGRSVFPMQGVYSNCGGKRGIIDSGIARNKQTFLQNAWCIDKKSLLRN